jgi:RecB family endonuclease NucS
VLRGHITCPRPEELLKFLNKHLRGGDCVIQVAGEFEVLYSGRAASTADAGDFLLLLKSDGSLQIHGHRGVKPVNWQPKSDGLDLLIEDGVAVLVSERRSPPEFVRVAFLEPAVAQALLLREVTGFVLMGSEAEMQQALARHPEIIEPGLTLLDRELPTGVGGIDLYARDAEGRFVVVELKRGKATQEAVHQLSRYVATVSESVGQQVRGILAAPAISKPALLQLERLGLQFREVEALPDMAAPGPTQEPLFG